MPLSPELRKRFAAHVEADDSASEDVILSLAADEMDGYLTDLQTVTEQAKTIEPLKAQVTSLKSELDASKAKVLTLSANGPATDPLIVGGLTELVDGKFEQAIQAGLPAKAVEALKPILRDGEGKLNVLALSACTSLAGDKPSRIALALADWAMKLAAGEYGKGVEHGYKPGAVGVLTMSGDKSEPVTKERKNELLALAGMLPEK